MKLSFILPLADRVKYKENKTENMFGLGYPCCYVKSWTI